MEKFIRMVLMTATGMLVYASVSVGGTYYVSPEGLATNSGTEQEPWSITKGFSAAAAGDTVYIKGGSYGRVYPKVANSGTAASRITFLGYDGTPVLDGEDYTGRAIEIIGKSHITIKNVRVKRYRYGFWCLTGSHYAVFEDCIADSCSNPTVGWDGHGFLVQDSNNAIIRNCSATDNGGNNFHIQRSNNSLIENCRAYCIQTLNNQWITDYYFVISWSTNCTIIDCIAEDINGSYKGNHGFIIKDTIGQDNGRAHSSGISFINCTAKRFEECFAISHGANNNLFENCFADNRGKNSSFNFCFMVRDGAYNNTFSNCTGIGKFNTGIVCIYDGVEGSHSQLQSGNLFKNCTFQGSGTGGVVFFLRNSVNNIFLNCTIVNTTSLFRFSRCGSGVERNTGTVLKNCILSGITSREKGVKYLIR